MRASQPNVGSDATGLLDSPVRFGKQNSIGHLVLRVILKKRRDAPRR